jgi:hypothetical protein
MREKPHQVRVQTRFGCAQLAAAALLVCAASGVAAEPIPPGWTAQNFEAVGFSPAPGFKLAIRQVAGRWYLYTAARPSGVYVIDVTDPANPKTLKTIPSPPNTWESQVSLHGDLMITGMSTPFSDAVVKSTAPDPTQAVQQPLPASKDFSEGVRLWSLKDPTNPVELSRWGAGALGTHRNSYPGGRYAFLTTLVPGFRGYILLILDVSDPKHPHEAGRWWYPGQKADEPVGDVVPGLHGPAAVLADGRHVVAGYTPGVVNLDISDPTKPKLIGKIVLVPPMAYTGAQSVHTAIPLKDGRLIYFNSESRNAACREGWNGAGLIDNANPAKPELLSIFPTPVPPPGLPYTNFCDKGGRFGPHNTNTELHSPDVEHADDHIYLTYFNAGLRYFDISDPRLPRETGWFVPPNPATAKAGQAGVFAVNQSQDVLVDTRGYAYVTDSAWGIWIVRHTTPPAPQPPIAPKP